ncbi:alpha/beta fold hydrolase [Burkholderia sp. AU31652]|uniref:alpha/beta fold hydrolase n=1 Tax=Burkholderia sp. AU31652 TaxID=2015354 RepID=UPI0035944275
MTIRVRSCRPVHTKSTRTPCHSNSSLNSLKERNRRCNRSGGGYGALAPRWFYCWPFRLDRTRCPRGHGTFADGQRDHASLPGGGRQGGTPIVLLGGYGETSHMWLPLISKLAVNHVVIAADLPGAGESDIPAAGYDK